jgi:hypothetical protein
MAKAQQKQQGKLYDVQMQKRLATVKEGKRALRLYANWEVEGRYFCEDDDKSSRGWLKRATYDDVRGVIKFFNDELGKKLLKRAKIYE